MFVHAPVGLHPLRTMVPSVWGLEIILVLVGNAHLSLQMYIGIQKKNDRKTESTSASQRWFWFPWNRRVPMMSSRCTELQHHADNSDEGGQKI